MVKVLEAGSGTEKCNCRNCDALLQYKPSEREYDVISTDYTGGSESAYRITCPCCGERTEL